MSRIGNAPVKVPAGVDVKINGAVVTVKGPKGNLEQTFDENMKIVLEEGQILVKRPDDSKKNRSLHGLTRALISNMVEGVTNGFEKKLEVNGVGYRAQKKGKELVMNLQFAPLIEKYKRKSLEVSISATGCFKGGYSHSLMISSLWETKGHKEV